ncbi:type 2 isopentenyl-diphosphate Delta-isomerase [Erwinia pyri]|uniref:Isopentenyl-diphosphate delta-isomerase n=1 Tax=Erwinia pyri TaxID=3062598 RepID=A0AA50HPI4_9GAMM|nr:type 2 isopentenyl-diphosphate Delta-isomerase [Erwinia sp. DE2]WLS77918.1 type 2 isopentenyl-diphosphate Delta-isomerase [Erwinia sp. DE2]
MKNAELIQRKNDHLDIVLNPAQAVSQIATGFAQWRFSHCAMPELDFNAVDISTSLFGKALKAPLMISSMTGGARRAQAINLHLAATAQALGLAMGVGSQRVALESKEDYGLNRKLRDVAPDIPLLANLGAAQISGPQGLDYARRAVEMIDADALIVHLNPLQEVLQTDGDRDWRGVLAALGELVNKLAVPVVVKEVGAGISPAVALRLAEAGVAMIDVAGAGGTSWAAVEGERARDPRQRAVAMAFANWGIPTSQALIDVRKALPGMPVVASGGIRDGIDVAKALRLGADFVGLAAAILPSATLSSEALNDAFLTLIDQLKTVCFCTGSADLNALRQAEIFYTGGAA